MIAQQQATTPDPIADFLATSGLPARRREQIRRHLFDGRNDLAAEIIPDNLQPAYRSAMTEAYRQRCAGLKFTVGNYMPVQGYCSPSGPAQNVRI